MKFPQFLNIVNKVLDQKGYHGVDIRDLPDQDFDAYYDPDFEEDEAIGAAEDLIYDMVWDGDLPDLTL